MNIIVGHTNMDLDCIGSMVLVRYLFPDFIAVRSHLVQPAARNLMNLYSDHLGFVGMNEIRGGSIERMVVVDTRAVSRIQEYTQAQDLSSIDIEIFDHHPSNGQDIPCRRIHENNFGSNTSQICLVLAEQGIRIDPEDATIALTGIYADTGNFTHANVRGEDFTAAAYLLRQGAELKLVKDFLVPLKDRHQVLLFHEILSHIERRSIRGHVVESIYMELEEDSQGLGAVSERVFEVENAELFLGFFSFMHKKKLLIIGRNSSADVRLNEILEDFGGGGHAQAASATIKTENGRELYEKFFAYLEGALRPAATAWDIMTEDVKVLSTSASLLEASKFFEETLHTGAPVIDENGTIAGVITLRDIMKGRKAGQMNASVCAYMSKRIITAPPNVTVREIDELLFQNSIGHLPITVDNKIVGIVTRKDFLEFKRNELRKKDILLKELSAALTT